jgi:hypothetical protein
VYWVCLICGVECIFSNEVDMFSFEAVKCYNQFVSTLVMDTAVFKKLRLKYWIFSIFTLHGEHCTLSYAALALKLLLTNLNFFWGGGCGPSPQVSYTD